MPRTLVVLLSVLWLSAGCDGALSGSDAGSDGGGSPDARVDGGRSDGGALDAGIIAEMDTGAVTEMDTGTVTIDAGHDAPDARPTDTGVDAPTDAGPYRASDRHTARATGYMSAPQGFWEYLPPDYAPGSGPGSPLLLAFHGLGENGDGSLAQLEDLLNVGPGRLIDRNEWPRDRPFIVLSPQQASSCPSAASITAFLAWARDHYRVDSTRIYLTGLSCGAIGIANYLRANVLTTDVAAVVAISGDWRSAWSTQMCALGRMPIWTIHGDADTNGGTLPDFSRIPMESLIACAAPPREEAILTMLPGVGHSGAAWNDSYAGRHGFDVFAWMLEHTRP
jgi:predicted esterase